LLACSAIVAPAVRKTLANVNGPSGEATVTTTKSEANVNVNGEL